MSEPTGSEPTNSEPTRPEPVVTVRGQAELRCPPDLATVWLTCHAQSKDADQVRRDLATASQRVAELLARHVAVIESHATSGVAVSPVFADRGRPAVTSHQGRVGTTVVIKDLDGLGELITALLGLPNAELGGPSWSLRTDNPVHAEARRAAIADGRRRAEDYAAAFGSTVTGLLEISDLDTGAGFPTPMRAMMARGAPEPAFELEPAEQTVNGSVTLRFSIATPRV